MCDKEKLMETLKQDIKRYSLAALKEAANYVDGQVLSQNGDDFLWWWDLSKAIREELDKRKRQ